jgi:hypothetical protein
MAEAAESFRYHDRAYRQNAKSGVP